MSKLFTGKLSLESRGENVASWLVLLSIDSILNFLFSIKIVVKPELPGVPLSPFPPAGPKLISLPFVIVKIKSFALLSESLGINLTSLRFIIFTQSSEPSLFEKHNFSFFKKILLIPIPCGPETPCSPTSPFGPLSPLTLPR